MSRDRKIALLNKLQTGKISLEDFRKEVLAMQKSPEIELMLSKLSNLELIKLISIDKKNRDNPPSITRDEYEFYNSMFDTMELRESCRVVFRAYYAILPCEVYEIKYKPELNRPTQYQLMIGYQPHPDVKYFDELLIMDFDLGQKFPVVIGAELTKPMIQKICDSYFIENGRTPGKMIFNFC